MTTSEQRQFPARLDVLPDMAAFAQAFCDRHGIVHDNALRLMFIIEELFTNTVEHGYRGGSDAPVRIALSLVGDRVGLLYEDAAPRYDPIARLSGLPGLPEGIARPVETRPVGGLGVFLVSQLVEGLSYVYEDGYNRLRLTLLLAS